MHSGCSPKRPARAGEIFGTSAFSTLNEIVLSTSTLASPALLGGGFGPVGPKCYGMGYGHHADMVRFGVMAYKERDAAGMCRHIRAAVADVRDAIVDGAPPPAEGEGQNS